MLGRPVQFIENDAAADRQAQDDLEKAARTVGFRNIEFQYEPIAAALDYELSVQKEELVFVVDIGGGTADFSIVRVSPEKSRTADRRGDILANRGVRVGGTDFDRMAEPRLCDAAARARIRQRQGRAAADGSITIFRPGRRSRSSIRKR